MPNIPAALGVDELEPLATRATGVGRASPVAGDRLPGGAVAGDRLPAGVVIGEPALDPTGDGR